MGLFACPRDKKMLPLSRVVAAPDGAFIVTGHITLLVCSTNISTIIIVIMMRNLALVLMALLSMVGSAMAAGRDTYTVIVSLDGLRWDYLDAFDVPCMDQMAQQGVKAVVQPSFPSKTFPNHYTLATGLVPDHHGIIANTFMDRSTGSVFSLGDSVTRSDPRYYGGDPVWLTARRQGVTSATVFWVGSDVAIQGMHANYWHDYMTEKISFPERVNEVIRLLSLPQDQRPHLVMAYFEEPDASGHRHGPISAPTRRSVQYMDSLMGVLWSRLQQLPIAADINLIVTGDHGMTRMDRDHFININDVLPQRWVRRACNDFPLLIYASQPQYVDSIWQALQHVDHIRAWRRGEVPAYLNYGSNVNMGDVIVLPDVGWLMDYKPYKSLGSHGFDHTAADMQVGFRAVGPDFKQGYVKPDRLPNVSIYPLLCHLLGITPSPCDGSLDDCRDMLAR